MTDWRKAVELIGWLDKDEEGEFVQIGHEPFSHYLNEPLPQWLKDAIAAQLVRQVDAHEWAEFRGTWMTSEVKDERTGKRLAYVEYTGSTPPYDDCDRSELAVNAILDSGVLEYDYR